MGDYQSGAKDLAHLLNELSTRILSTLESSSGQLKSNPGQLDASPLSALVEVAGTTFEELQVACEEMSQQNEQLTSTQEQLMIARLQHQELFEFSQVPCIITRPDGIIRQANRAAAQLCNRSQEYLASKPLSNYLTLACRRDFRWLLQQVTEHPLEQALKLQPFGLVPIDVLLTASSMTDFAERPGIRWLIRPIHSEATHPAPDSDSESFQPLHPSFTYTRGDVISVNPPTVWQVQAGLVKLTTTCADGNEILVGLVGPPRPFGGPSAVLPGYRATVLSDQAQLVNLSFIDPENDLLAASLRPLLDLRLQQTEQLLWVMGQRRVEDRAYQLLQVLKQEFGEPVPQGTRLTVRLTHQEMADACGTTRVTMTRVLNQMIREGKLVVDDERHIIICEGLK